MNFSGANFPSSITLIVTLMGMEFEHALVVLIYGECMELKSKMMVYKCRSHASFVLFGLRYLHDVILVQFMNVKASNA